MPLFDWRCPKHGTFERSHPICPGNGCDSADVVKVFLKAPGARSDSTRRFDAGIRKSAEMMNLSNFRSAKAGESSKIPMQQQVLWGNEVNKALPNGMGAMTQMAAKQANTVFKTTQGDVRLPNNGMRQAANETKITSRPLPAAERQGVRGE